MSRERLHVPSPLYPADWQPQDAEEIWQSAPTTFERACVAWCAAAEASGKSTLPAGAGTHGA